ncbi:hypothetical protein HN51_004493, partial [Arachis hypogaea]
MGPEAFRKLCQKLRGTGRVKDLTRPTVEEQTISRHFHNVLQAILSLEGEFFKQPSGEK